MSWPHLPRVGFNKIPWTVEGCQDNSVSAKMEGEIQVVACGSDPCVMGGWAGANDLKQFRLCAIYFPGGELQPEVFVGRLGSLAALAGSGDQGGL